MIQWQKIDGCIEIQLEVEEAVSLIWEWNSLNQVWEVIGAVQLK